MRGSGDRSLHQERGDGEVALDLTPCLDEPGFKIDIGALPQSEAVEMAAKDRDGAASEPLQQCIDVIGCCQFMEREMQHFARRGQTTRGVHRLQKADSLGQPQLKLISVVQTV